MSDEIMTDEEQELYLSKYYPRQEFSKKAIKKAQQRIENNTDLQEKLKKHLKEIYLHRRLNSLPLTLDNFSDKEIQNILAMQIEGNHKAFFPSKIDLVKYYLGRMVNTWSKIYQERKKKLQNIDDLILR